MSQDQLSDRAVVPTRLALIYRQGQTLGYNPVFNVWHRLDELSAEVLRWLRARRNADQLQEHLANRFHLDADDAKIGLDGAIEWLLLRRMLYLDKEPQAPELTMPADPLGTVYWICTQKCNLRCTYCYQEATIARPNELSTEEAIALVDQAVDAGVTTFVFTGGEPFSRRDILTVAQHSKSRGLRTTVITNGGYITPKNVNTVASIFDLVTVSLDHVKPEHHDRLRGRGTWRRAARALELLLGTGVSVDVNSTLSQPGLADLQDLLRLSREKSIGQHKIVPQFPMGRAAEHRDDELTPSQLIGLNDKIYRLNQELDDQQPRNVRAEGGSVDKGSLRVHCGAGLSEVSVDPEGWVYPCKLLQYPQFRSGNIRETPLAEIYEKHPVLGNIRATTAKQLQPCSTCIIRNACGGGCRGIHFSFTNDYIQAHPLFCAYLRRSFEGRAWATTGEMPGERRSVYAEEAPFSTSRTTLPVISVSGEKCACKG
jgi:radical SAM protein with 4Fe4S-binding SPASM domain